MSDILSIGLSGLQAAQLGLATSSENISNSSTPGYVLERPVYQEADGQYSGSGYVGGGVQTATIQRAYSQYLTSALNNAQSTNSSLNASYQLATQLNNLIGSPTGGIASAITAVFTGLQAISTNAADVATRQSAISDAQTLVDQINQAGQQYSSIRASINTQLQSTVSQVNQYSQQIAQLNTEIASATAQGQPPNQLLDTRDQVVANLSQLVGVQVVQNSNGYSLFLGNGQPLVVGSQNFNLTTEVSASDPSEMDVAYQGLPGATTPPQQLSSAALTGGTIGGLLSFRSGTLDPAEAQLGAIATSFAAQLNAQNALGLTLGGTEGGDLISVGAPNVINNAKNTGDATLDVSLTDPESPPSDDYTLSFDGTNYTLTDKTTGQAVGSGTSIDDALSGSGLSATVNGTMNAGDSFTIQPTRGALDSFALVTSDPSAIAAASPIVGTAATTNTGSATITQSVGSAPGFVVPSTPTTISYQAPASPGQPGTLSGFAPGSTVTVTVPGSNTPVTSTIDGSGNATPPVQYDPSLGATVSITNPDGSDLSGVSFTLSGKPDDGDSFTLASNVGGTKDGTNALAMSNLTSSTAMSSSTLTNAYANYINGVGNTVGQLKASTTSQASLVSQLTSQQQSVQGVNLDEEAANLMQYQQLYQANSKVIQTAATLFQTLLGIFQ
ncbi:flagellar hook-associated protein FlgK [Paraburkholderia caballeronis]|uniref:Flagellar hook-associated protein 1 n=1 Tax=Paraburkholderia caballeronis TaxID=416943 RepID=A0A1H7SKX4_9BURK|nr:flagellar hook-associated protein FlgK [Paraburkholderia caballeronis]PXW22367.1 flagellar hook-associated protein 1 FlgK [Paraburkholderia caballeronis]PXW96025.1 flagellar hook-associated protein 1 FlgK [Paraburkholderia caballeronis]RAJ92391.1 flagellar hook-associated protein 1 FlgK [Paraburkholderia caballeronis]TDV27943.1 flagellar hook-associated protein 1 FlgK [Paraburkholderia caballeronis]SEB50492.1 flagellar hook-associated protein 1 FlgK [Paraburkholderia caballeronis]